MSSELQQAISFLEALKLAVKYQPSGRRVVSDWHLGALSSLVMLADLEVKAIKHQEAEKKGTKS